MTGLWIARGVLWTATIGSGLLGGLYLAFSVAVMPALAARPAEEAAAAMQAVNRAILNPAFGLLFAGTALACLLTAGSPLVAGGDGSGWRIAGGLVGLLGFVSTAVVNIPLNTRLDRDGTAVWARFLAEWVPANHVRALTSVAAAVLLTLALRAT
jgi:uncharacterized membrane protein